MISNDQIDFDGLRDAITISAIAAVAEFRVTKIRQQLRELTSTIDTELEKLELLIGAVVRDPKLRQYKNFEENS
jgi:hypothetical protein